MIPAPLAIPPVRISAPDLSPWEAGNTGIPYAWSWTAPTPGPHVALTALVHGNELCGAIILDELLRAEIRPARGRLSLIFCNIDAFARFDPQAPEAARLADEDFNRLWDGAIPTGESRERRRARALAPLLAEIDVLLDLHSMQYPSPPLILAGMQPRAVDLARRLGEPPWIICDRGHAAGRRLRDWGAFDDPASPRTALLIECGQHWQPETVALCRRAATRFLAITGCAPAPAPAPQTGPVLVEVTDTITAASDAFRFRAAFVGMERIPRAGTVIADDGTREIRTPYDDCVLVMPAHRARRGLTAVRLGRIRP